MNFHYRLLGFFCQLRLRRQALPLCCVILFSACSSTSPRVDEPTELEKSPPAVKTATPAVQLEFAAVGDVMLGTDFPEDRLPPDNGKALLADMAHEIASADIAFGNLEGVLLDGGEPVKVCKNPKACYLFRSPTVFAQTLRDAGFDVMSLANNHARDFGEPGRDSSMQALQRVGILHSGREGDVASWERKGVRIALIAFAPFRGAHDFLDIPRAQSQVAELAKSHDIVVVSMHGGAEGEAALRVPFAEEEYYGENRGDVVKFSHAVIDAGADLVFGHGPHVPRALELYQGRLVAYSLGNFSTYYGVNVRGIKGLAPLLRVRVNANGEFLSGRVVSARQRRPLGPQPDASLEAAQLMAQLTRMDFPLTPLRITPDGEIIPMLAPTLGVIPKEND